MVTALNKAGHFVFHGVCVWGEQVLMTHIHDRYIIRAILVQGFCSFQTACLHDHTVSASAMTADCIINIFFLTCFPMLVIRQAFSW